jgi:hypothetical protein
LVGEMPVTFEAGFAGRRDAAQWSCGGGGGGSDRPVVAEPDAAAMADAMASLLLDPECAVTIGAAGRRRVLAHYTRDKAVTACARS